MGKIRQLPSSIVSKIAAGEVVERPAYAVKELLENAIDAGADYIRIDIEKSGLQKIMVTDNGEGMSREDVQIAFLPHTTSKIYTDEDLQTIKSMGFRGEALASITAISNLTIRSKTAKDLAGTEINLEGNKVVNVSPIGMPTGTTVIVENLFGNVPARKKFLRSLQTESRHIIQIVTNIALAHPQIRFFLTHNKKAILDLPIQNPTERIQTILGNNIFQYLIPIGYSSTNGHSGKSRAKSRDASRISMRSWTSQDDINLHENPYLQITGFISKPQLSQSSQNKQYIFVNNRHIKNKLISQTIKEAYGTLLPPNQYPIFVLHLHVPVEMIDVNVHPRKEEIHFHNQNLITGSLTKAISEMLTSHNLTFQDQRWKRSEYKSELTDNYLVREGSTDTFAAELLRENIKPYTLEENKQIILNDVLQIDNLFLLTQTSQALLLIDQHAAHERILYEKLLEKFKKNQSIGESYSLPHPPLLHFSITDTSALQDNLKLFSTLGFIIKYSSNNSFKVIAVPLLFKDRNISEIIQEIINNLAEDKNPKQIDQKTHRMLTYIACRSAIKAGEKLTKKQSKDLVQQLLKTENNTTCPHGRPTQIEISLKDLQRMFRRI